MYGQYVENENTIYIPSEWMRKSDLNMVKILFCSVVTDCDTEIE